MTKQSAHAELTIHSFSVLCCRLSPYGTFGDVGDDKPNATNRYLTEQLNQFGLAYLHMVEPRVAGYMDVEVEDDTYNLGHFRKLWKSTFIAAGKSTILRTPLYCQQCSFRLLHQISIKARLSALVS